MAIVLILNIWLALVLSGAESCFIPNYVVEVPQTIWAGYQVTRFADCDTKSMRFTSTDPSFTISRNGEIVASSSVSVAETGRTFSVWVRDPTGAASEKKVFLVRQTAPKGQQSGFLKRSKRRWSPPPFNILENFKGPYPYEIEKIVSDSAAKYDVYYTASGPGFSEHPMGLFSLHRKSGMLSVHRAVDREEFPQFTFIVDVFEEGTNRRTDDPLPVTVLVDDVNDNAPQFKEQLKFTVLEQSKPGTIVGKVNATDRDKVKTLHVKVKYSLLDGLDLFSINSETGVITTVTNTLDREAKDKHMVTVKIQDMDGAVTGLSNTGTATISLDDINDNPPTFTKTSYAATVKENENEKLILRIPVEDKDLRNTPNWISKFVITKGNENGNFRMATDPKTNEGLLYVSKPLNYEQNKNVKLEIMAQNEAALTGTTASWVSIPVDVAVTNEDEGPQFTAPTIRFNIKENIPNGTLIGSYTAVDPETDSSEGIKYYKENDPASWISVDRNTGELRVANTIDRESHYVQDGIYNITMKAVDSSTKSGTGTVIIAVEDVNDNKPTFPTSDLVLCEKEGELGSVIVVAEDNDDKPLSSPFTFSLPNDNDGKWSLAIFNNTAATLKQKKELPTGVYKVPVQVMDLQGYGGEQVATVRICQCRNGECLTKPSSISLGPLGILTLLLPLALLLLLLALLAFFCVTHEKLPIDGGDSGGILIKSNTEAPGEEVDSSLLVVPVTGVDTITKGSVKGSALNAGWLGNKSVSTMGAQSIHENGMYMPGVVTTEEYYSGQYNSQYGGAQQQLQAGNLVGSGVDFDGRYTAQDSAFLHTWQTNGRYLNQKLTFFREEGDERYANDIVHAYGFEGQGSAAGSIGCCSDYDESDDLSFLNTLGPKFKTLADVCTNT